MRVFGGICALGAALVIPAPAPAASPSFPGSDPTESVRSNTPDDPGFDRCESDNEEGPRECTNVFEEQFERFGFAPDGSQETATYRNHGCLAAVSTATLPLCQDFHTRRLIRQNLRAGRFGPGQVSGVSADAAWKYSTGDPDVDVAILDTGIRWSNGELRRKVALNRGELPAPRDADGECPDGDCDDDPALTVDDYAEHPGVSPDDGRAEADAILDASDLIAALSDGADDDGNGYVDDIAGWDFFDDDNDPYDASSYSSASNHGTGRAEEAGAETNDASGGAGVCPRCRIVPIRVWDTFVVDTNNFALGVLYAADNGVEVVEGAVGGLSNTRFAREAFAHAYERGVFLALVSSDLNTANHNYPTNYDETMYVAGTVSDVHGLGQSPPPGLVSLFADLGVPLDTNAPVGTWFRNSGTTQYGGHAHVVMPATTGSAATGQAAGAAGLVASYGLQRARAGALSGGPLRPNEIKQLLTTTAEDVKPVNTIGVGLPDPAQMGWDQHFGYGRPDLGLALELVDLEKVPPQAMITSPDWFAPLEVGAQGTVAVGGRLSAHRAPIANGGRYEWRLQWAPGIEPCASDFRTVAQGSEADPVEGTIGTVDLEAVRDALDARRTSTACGSPPQPVEGGSTPDPTAPLKGPGDVDPNEPAFTVRVQVTDTRGNTGEDRKVLFAHEDATLHPGWSRPIGGRKDSAGEAATGGESSHRMFDVDGDNDLELLEATSSGELHVLREDGSPLPSFNGGEPVRTRPYPNVHGGAPAYADVEPPLETLRIPAIGDIDGDLEPEIVDTAGEHLYAWEMDGSRVDGFPVRIDPALSAVALRSRDNHIKRGFLASPTLGDVVGDDALEVVAPALDQHVYAWDGRGRPLPGFPARLRERGADGPIPCSAALECAEIINTAAVGDIAGDERPEIVVPTAEFDDNPSAPQPPTGLSGLGGVVTNALANVLGGSSRVYAIDSRGEVLPGWPTKPNGVLPDALPFVGPGVDHVLGDVDDDPVLEAIGNIATGEVTATNGDGSTAVEYDSQPTTGEHVDKSKVLNLFENPIVADLDGSGGPEVLKGGITLSGLVNIGVAVGQNLPFNHVLQGWSGEQGTSLPSFPQAVEDFQLLSSPAVADVSDAPGSEAIVGTGLYLIRNIAANGAEGSGWPKFTGGWNFAVPAVGDADGDGELEVASMTREGFSFLWDTDSPACATNDEWWTYRHDEWSTGAYGTDTRPPGSAEGVEVRRSQAAIRVRWSSPGDDWMCGEPDRFRVLAANGAIEAPADGTVAVEREADRTAGEAVEVELTGRDARARHVAVVYRDEAGNWGHVAGAAVPGGAGGRVVEPDPGGEPIATPLGACANPIDGTRRGERLTGTPDGDEIRGRGGRDRIRAGDGDDCVRGGPGRDRIRCGPGRDTVVAARRDRVRGCERLRRPGR